ncbi:hypothetical protein EGT74_04850 [Chitinophaga lutea]|uniref:Uncharacterized protein n=1 Tax=Chitinophaga lutea TaxID=2488634 RepID=A0A3N4PZQ3_9BACT|nr:hypothetical protein [Chitinophaga lutea]RPE12875.1 hypothetical protein EGT74_04850 [Chitinophaga lutea]
MKQFFQQIGAILLLGVFCLYITPRDYVHHFVGHEDTIDEACNLVYTDGPVLSGQHQHCEWLHWEVEAYLPGYHTAVPATPHEYATLSQTLPLHIFSYPAYYFSLRAPPHA